MATLENETYPKPGSLAKIDNYVGVKKGSFAIYLGRAEDIMPNWRNLNFSNGYELVFWEQSRVSLQWYKCVRDVRPWNNQFIEWVWLKE